MYKEFSNYYDILTFDIDYKKYANNIFNILDKESISNGSILEIGCGSGNLTKELAKKDFQILAFDNSEQMLNMSYNKLIEFDNVNLIMQDMYKFPYDRYEFDAVISLLDVINYIRDKDKLIFLFKSIFNSLKSGGVFIFDLNSEYKLKTVLGSNTYVYEKDNIFYTWENSIEEDLIYFDLNFFVKKDGSYTRFEEHQIERYYSIEFIIKELEKIGFKDLSYVDEDSGEPYKKEKTQRILFKAVKP